MRLQEVPSLLVNIRGEIIGINTAILTGGQAVWQGIGFAIPSNTIRRGLDSYVAHGRIVRGQLGVLARDLTPELARQVGLDRAEGALVEEVVPQSPARRAGIRRGDVLVTFDGQLIREVAELRRLVMAAEVGDEVEIGLWREGEELRLTAEIAEIEEQRR